MLDVASLAMRLWNEHRHSANLPDWEIVGLEIVGKGPLRQAGSERPPRLTSSQRRWLRWAHVRHRLRRGGHPCPYGGH